MSKHKINQAGLTLIETILAMLLIGIVAAAVIVIAKSLN